jgi:hypothetical protein
MKRAYQSAKDKTVDRGWHVWRPHPGGRYKCVICGGVTKMPTNEDACDTYEHLTTEERHACPEHTSRHPHTGPGARGCGDEGEG